MPLSLQNLTHRLDQWLQPKPDPAEDALRAWLTIAGLVEIFAHHIHDGPDLCRQVEQACAWDTTAEQREALLEMPQHRLQIELDNHMGDHLYNFAFATNWRDRQLNDRAHQPSPMGRNNDAFQNLLNATRDEISLPRLIDQVRAGRLNIDASPSTLTAVLNRQGRRTSGDALARAYRLWGSKLGFLRGGFDNRSLAQTMEQYGDDRLPLPDLLGALRTLAAKGEAHELMNDAKAVPQPSARPSRMD